eukprot:6718138-Lingulodinium_polyedra.AAC.1
MASLSVRGRRGQGAGVYAVSVEAAMQRSVEPARPEERRELREQGALREPQPGNTGHGPQVARRISGIQPQEAHPP